MVKDHSNSKRGNPVPPHGLLFPISSKGSFICIIHRQDDIYHSICYTSHGALAGTRNSSMGQPHEGLIHHTMSRCSNHRSTSSSSIPFRRIDPTTHHTTSRCSITTDLHHLAPFHLEESIQRPITPTSRCSLTTDLHHLAPFHLEESIQRPITPPQADALTTDLHHLAPFHLEASIQRPFHLEE